MITPEVAFGVLQITDSNSRSSEGALGSGMLSAATVTQLRNVLAKHLEQPHAPLDTLAAILTKVAREARGRHIQAEQLVVIFKNIWGALPESPRAVDFEAQQQLRQHLITLCIKAYYTR